MLSTRTRLSVIVPCFNVEPYVEACLDSLVRQRIDGMELIVIDDASTDGTWEKIEKYADFPFVTTERLEKNGGLGAARNRGMALSHGDYLLFVDSDDWLKDGVLEKLANWVEAQESDLIFFDYARVYPRAGMIASPYHELYKSAAVAKSLSELKSLLLELPPMAWFKLYRRTFVIASGVRFGEGFYEDVSWTYPLTLRAESIRVISEVLYCYRQREGSILNQRDFRHLDLIAEYTKVLEFSRSLEGGKYRNQIVAKMATHYELILFNFSHRLGWSGLRQFFNEMQLQFALLDLSERQQVLDSAKPGAGFKRRQAMLEGNFARFLAAFFRFKLTYSVQRPFQLLGVYFSKRRIKV